MKTLFALLVAADLSMAGYSQTNQSTNAVWITNYVTGPGLELFQFLGTGSNWVIAPYGILASGEKDAKGNTHHDFGGGIAAGYKLNDFLIPTLRLDYLYGTLWMPSASLQLQAPMRLFDKVTVIPFVFPGIATPLSGKGADNGTAVGIFGIGGAVRIGSHFDILADYEKWTGFPGHQIRVGFAWKPKGW